MYSEGMMLVGKAKIHNRKNQKAPQLTNATLDYGNSKEETSTETLSIGKQAAWNQLYPFLLVILAYIFIYTIYFAPVIFYGKLLAPGDGLNQSLPAFLSPRTLWTTLLFGGYPIAADIQNMTWYPLSLLFSLLHSWNIFVISAYVIASSFTFGLVYTLTHSKISGFIAGLIFGMSGFFMAHLGHTNMIQSAAWLPAILLCLERLKPKFNAGWFAALSLTIAMSFLAGHTQIFVYSIGLAGLYVLITGWDAPLGRTRYYTFALLGIFLGICLTGIQLLPSVELSKLSVRESLSFPDFVSYSLRPKMLVMLLFPYIFGGSAPSLYGASYFGPWNLTELTGYIGILPLILALFGAYCHRENIQAWFWGAVAIVCLLLVLGDSTPLAAIMYHLPGYDLFRVPARHFVEYSLAVSILAGYGVAGLHRSLEAKRWTRLRWCVIIMLAIFMGAYLGIIIFQTKLHGLPVDPLKNPAVSIPILIMILAGCSLFCLKNIPEKLRYLLIILLVIIDLGSFGHYYEWRYYSPTSTQLASNQTIEKYKNELTLTHQRMIPVDGALGDYGEIWPNLSRVWEVPSASGYGPLLLTRFSKLLGLAASGNLINDQWAFRGNRSLDLMAVRYLFIAKNEAYPAPDLVQDGIGWSQDDIGISLCPLTNPNVTITTTPRYATKVALVTALANSVNIPNGTTVGKLTVTTIDGKTFTFPILAGRDTSEWAWDRPDVQPLIKHQRAQIFSSTLQQDARVGSFEGHNYLCVFPLGGRYQISNLKLQWLPLSVELDYALNVSKISLADSTGGLSYPVTIVSSALSDTSRWQHVEDLANTVVYANLRAMPRAWLVPRVTSLQPNQVLNAAQTSKLPDGSTFSPQDVALVEEPLTLQSSPSGFSGQAIVARENATSIGLTTNANAPAFLVLSDIYYPGWKATVDGQPAKIFQTDYVLRGIVIPTGGRHTIRLYFFPTSFYLGLALTVFTIILLIGLMILLTRRQKRMAIQAGKHFH
jgi:hypothetical protein